MNTYWSAVTAAQAAVDCDETMFGMLHIGVGWRALAPAVRDLARAMVLRFAEEGNDRGLRIMQVIEPKRIHDLAVIIAQGYDLNVDELTAVTVKLSTKIMRGSVRRPFIRPRLAMPQDERTITAGLCIVALMIIGIDANCRRVSGEEEASVWTVIDGLRSHPIAVG